MRRFREYLSLSFLLLLGAVPAAGQTVRSEPAPAPRLAGFGTAIAIGDGEIFVSRSGASLLLPLLPSRTGGVHVFRPGANGEWEEAAHLTGSDAGVGVGFGTAMAVDGNTLLVGAPGQYQGRGAVYLYQRDGSGEWREVGVLSAGDGVPGDSLGVTVALRGDVALVGAPRHAEATGAVYVFRGSAWTQQRKLTASDARPADRFGVALAFDGARALIGAVGRDSTTGRAYVLGYDGGAWREEAVIQPADLGPRAAFGARLALAGDHAIIAAPQANRSAGAAFAFARDASGQWIQRGGLDPVDSSPGSFFGFNIVISGDEAWIGAPGTSGLTGAMYRFRRDASGNWSAAPPLTLGDLPPQAFFGGSVAVRNDVAVIAALGTEFGEGSGYIFQRDAGGEWRERGVIVDEAGGMSAIAGGQVNCTEGMAAEIFDCADVDVVSFLPVSDVGAGRGVAVSDVWGWTDAETGKEYAIVGRFDGTVFLDVSDPYNPKYLGELPLTEGARPNLWRDMKVYQDHAFIVSDGAGPHGIQIFDLAQLRDVADAPVTFEETAHYDGIHSAHNIVINEETGFAYTVGNSMGGETCGGAFHMVNIQDPMNPTFAGCFSDPSTGRTGTGYNHDAQCVTYAGPDTDHVGKEICFGSAETALSIADVTDKENPVALAAASYPNVGYAHQGWITDDHKYFYMNDELDEIAGSTPRTRTLIWDVTDLDDPILAKEHMGTTAASDHNLYVRGNLMYQSNYVAGLRIFDISDPVNPQEVAYFDTVPFGENVPGFAGTWSNYPYFESGIIVVTSMREGVFILKKRDTRLVF
jgi:choice-of-anchor B domain-containing protein